MFQSLFGWRCHFTLNKAVFSLSEATLGQIWTVVMTARSTCGWVCCRGVGVLYCRVSLRENWFPFRYSAELISRRIVKHFWKVEGETVILPLCKIIALSWWCSIVKMTNTQRRLEKQTVGRAVRNVPSHVLKSTCHLEFEDWGFWMCTISHCGKKAPTPVRNPRTGQSSQTRWTQRGAFVLRGKSIL